MSRAGGTLCLDFSLRTGWAYGHAGERPISGAWVLPDMSDMGRCYAALDNELSDALVLHQPSRVLCEAPLRFRRQTSAELLLGLWSTAQQTCYRASVAIAKVDVSTVRSDVMGTSRLGPTDECKAKVMAWCRGMGWPVHGDDEADAMLLWAWATNIRAPKVRRAA